MFVDISSDDDDEWQPPSALADDSPATQHNSLRVAARTRAHESLVGVDIDDQMQRLEQLVPREWDEMDAEYEWFLRTTFQPPLEFNAELGPAEHNNNNNTNNNRLRRVLADDDDEDEDDDDDDDDEFSFDDDDEQSDNLYGRFEHIPEREVEFLIEETTVEGLTQLKKADAVVARPRHTSGRLMRSSPLKSMPLASSPPPNGTDALPHAALHAPLLALPPLPSSVRPPQPPPLPQQPQQLQDRDSQDRDSQDRRVLDDGFVRPLPLAPKPVVAVARPVESAVAQLHASLGLKLEREWLPPRSAASAASSANELAELLERNTERERREANAPYMAQWPVAGVTRRVRVSAALRAQLGEQLGQCHQLHCQALVLSRYSASRALSNEVAAMLVLLEEARRRAASVVAARDAADAADAAAVFGAELLRSALLPRALVATYVQHASAQHPLSMVGSLLASLNAPFAAMLPDIERYSVKRLWRVDDELLTYACSRFANHADYSWTRVGELAARYLLRHRTVKECCNRLRNRASTRDGAQRDAACAAARVACLDPLTDDEELSVAAVELEHPEWPIRAMTHEAAVALVQSQFYPHIAKLLPHRLPFAVPRLYVQALARRKRLFASRARGRPRVQRDAPTTTTTTTTTTAAATPPPPPSSSSSAALPAAASQLVAATLPLAAGHGVRGRPRKAVVAARAAVGLPATTSRRIMKPSSVSIDPSTLVALAARTSSASNAIAASASDAGEQFEIEDLCSTSDESFELENDDENDDNDDDNGGGDDNDEEGVNLAKKAPLQSSPYRSPPKRSYNDVASEFHKRARTPTTTTATTATATATAIEEHKWTMPEDRAILVHATQSGLLQRALAVHRTAAAAATTATTTATTTHSVARALFGGQASSSSSALHDAAFWAPLLANALFANRSVAAVAQRFDELVAKMACR